MKTDVEWALLSPEGTYHKLCEPNFFVGREDDMDLTLKVGFINFRFSFFSLSMFSLCERPGENFDALQHTFCLTSPVASSRCILFFSPHSSV